MDLMRAYLERCQRARFVGIIVSEQELIFHSSLKREKEISPREEEEEEREKKR